MKKDGTTDTNPTDPVRTDTQGMSPAWSCNAASGYRFPKIDHGAGSYFDAASPGDDFIYGFGFGSIPELKDLIRERTGGRFTEEEITKLAVEVFRNKPRPAAAGAQKPDPQKQDDESRPVDFIYQM